jgi:hypothetical protein
MTGAATRTVAADCTLSSTSSPKPVSPTVICRSVFRRFCQSSGRRPSAPPGWRCASRQHRGLPRMMPPVVSAVRRTCLRRYGHQSAGAGITDDVLGHASVSLSRWCARTYPRHADSCVTMTTVEPRRWWRIVKQSGDLAAGACVQVARGLVGEEELADCRRMAHGAIATRCR